MIKWKYKGGFTISIQTRIVIGTWMRNKKNVHGISEIPNEDQEHLANKLRCDSL